MQVVAAEVIVIPRSCSWAIQSIGNSESRKKYSRIYNNLKAHKQRGTISMNWWNRQVAATQRLKDAFVEGRISKEEYIQQPDAL